MKRVARVTCPEADAVRHRCETAAPSVNWVPREKRRCAAWKQTRCQSPVGTRGVTDGGVKLPYTVDPYLRMATFAAVVRNGSVRTAAGELRVTPSAISQQIRQLEEELGVALFGRAGR